jgi:hypothetical protein
MFHNLLARPPTTSGKSHPWRDFGGNEKVDMGQWLAGTKPGIAMANQ